MATGRPKKEFDKKTFQDLVGLNMNVYIQTKDDSQLIKILTG